MNGNQAAIVRHWIQEASSASFIANSWHLPCYGCLISHFRFHNKDF
jgi:hypothetical protein